MFLKHGYFAVEAFFMISGIMLYISYKNKSLTTKEYLISRYKKFYPKYFLAAISIFLYLILDTIKNGDISNIILIFKRFLVELGLIQNLNFLGGGNNYPLWYLSVTIWGGTLIYFLLRKNDKLFIKYLFPLYILIYYFVIIFKFNSIEVWENMYIISFPLLRGIADMSLGIVLYNIFNKIKKKNTIFNFLLFLGGLFLSILFMFIEKEMIVLELISISIMIIGALSIDIKNAYITQFSSHMFTIYLFHALFIYIIGIKGTLFSNVLIFILLIVIITLFALVFDIVILKISKIRHMKYKKIEKI